MVSPKPTFSKRSGKPGRTNANLRSEVSRLRENAALEIIAIRPDEEGDLRIFEIEVSDKDLS